MHRFRSAPCDAVFAPHLQSIAAEWILIVQGWGGGGEYGQVDSVHQVALPLEKTTRARTIPFDGST